MLQENVPTVIELPMALEPVGHDPFIDGLGVVKPSSRSRTTAVAAADASPASAA